MTDTRYGVFIGHVPWEPERLENAEGNLVQFKVRAVDGTTARITLPPQFHELDIFKGDFVAVEGKIRTFEGDSRSGGLRTYIEIEPVDIAVLPSLRTSRQRPINRIDPSEPTRKAPF